MNLKKKLSVARDLSCGPLTLAAIFLAVVHLSRTSAAPAPPPPVGAQEETRAGRGEFRARWSEAAVTIEVRAAGEVEFTDDDTDVRSISADGYLVVEERRGTERRALRVAPGAGGALVRSFAVREQARDFDAEGRLWLAAVLPKVVRRTGLGARGRVERILRQRGPAGVLDEIGRLEGDTTKRIYFEELIKKRGSDPETLRQAAREIKSSAELQAVLVAADARAPGDRELTRELIAAAASITSDASKREVLTLVARRKGGDNATAIALINASVGISSNADRADVLVEAARTCSSDAAVLTAFLKAVESLDSSAEQERALFAMLRKDGLSKEILARTSALARNSIESNASKEAVLEMVRARLSREGTPR